MSEQILWDKAAEQIAELTLSAMSRKLHGLDQPTGSFEEIIKQACLDYDAQVTAALSATVKERDELRKELTNKQEGNPHWLLARNQDLRTQNDELKAQVENIREALQTIANGVFTELGAVEMAKSALTLESK